MDKFLESTNEYYLNFEKEILAEFPELAPLISMRYMGKDAESALIAAEGQLKPSNALYKNSQYYYQEKEKSFLHFTSFQSLLSILNSQSIRLKTLNGMNDINEINYAAKLFQISGKPLEFLQKEIFSLSLVKFISSDTEIGNNTNNLDLWRFYGLNGEGVSIKFKILNDPMEWKTFHLSQIHYGERGVEGLKKLQQKLEKFNGKYPTMYIHLSNIFSFHKSSHYKNEDEIRLIFSTIYNFREHKHQLQRWVLDEEQQLPANPEKIFETENYFTYLPLSKIMNTDLENRLFKFAPQIEIEEVILGYKFEEKELALYQNVIQSVQASKGGINIDSENIYITDLKKLFRT